MGHDLDGNCYKLASLSWSLFFLSSSSSSEVWVSSKYLSCIHFVEFQKKKAWTNRYKFMSGENGQTSMWAEVFEKGKYLILMFVLMPVIMHMLVWLLYTWTVVFPLLLILTHHWKPGLSGVNKLYEPCVSMLYQMVCIVSEWLFESEVILVASLSDS